EAGETRASRGPRRGGEHGRSRAGRADGAGRGSAPPQRGERCEGRAQGEKRGPVADQLSYSMTTSTSPVPTVSPVATRSSVTVPDFSALMWFSIFIASSTTSA